MGAMRCLGGSSGAAGSGSGSALGAGGASGVLQALSKRLVELEAAIAREERWEKGRPVGAEGLREEYDALLATQKALCV